MDEVILMDKVRLEAPHKKEPTLGPVLVVPHFSTRLTLPCLNTSIALWFSHSAVQENIAPAASLSALHWHRSLARYLSLLLMLFFIASCFSFYRVLFSHDRNQTFLKFSIKSWLSLKSLSNKIMEPGAFFFFPVNGHKI